MTEREAAAQAVIEVVRWVTESYYDNIDIGPTQFGALWDALARYDAAPKDEWQPIETAPKDGTKILLLGIDGECEVGFWNPDGDSWADDNGQPCEAGRGTIQVTGSWFSCGGWFQPNEVTAWAPIPLRPSPSQDE